MIASAESSLFLRSRLFNRFRRALHRASAFALRAMARQVRHQALVFGLLAVALSASTFADSASGSATTNALKDAVILVIRHAEKPGKGATLSPEGGQRAEAYVRYFEQYTVEGQPLGLDYLVATADSAGSERPRLTVEPLSKALGLKIDLRFKSKEYQELAADLRTHPRGKRILICWHHGKIPELVTALGADAGKLLPGGKLPDDEFGWVLELRFDHNGQLVPGETKRIEEGLIIRQTSQAN
jgi:hypothetical protein